MRRGGAGLKGIGAALLAALLVAAAPALAQRPERGAAPRLPLQITVPDTLPAGSGEAPIALGRRAGDAGFTLREGRPPVVPPLRAAAAPVPAPASAGTPAIARPMPRPSLAAAAPGAPEPTISSGTRPPLIPPRAPRAAMAEQIAAAVAVAAAEPVPQATDDAATGLVTSPRPQARSRAAIRRYERAAAREARRSPVLASASAGTRAVSGSSGGGLCGSSLLRGRALDPVRSSTSGCGIDNPVSVTHVNGIRLSQAATLHCDAAQALGRWVANIAEPALARTGGGIAEIQVAGHYTCRPRNNQRGARISEHGRGRAIDISGFRLANGDRIVILNHYNRSSYSRALVQMRQGACGVFRTVLGPGSDRFHADHFHFDSAQHRGGGSYCR